MRGTLENSLKVCTHIDVFQALIALINDEVADMRHVKILLLDQLQNDVYENMS